MKKIGNIMFAICLILFITISCFVKPLSSLDEVWNFNIGRCIANGLIPYKDISMVSTPLLGFILAIPLKLLGQEMFYTRAVILIIVLLSFFCISKIFKNLGIRKEIVYWTYIIIAVSICDFIRIDYNVLVLLFVLQIILLEVKTIKNERWKKEIVDLIIGLLAGLSICSKQSVGLIISFISVFIPILFIENRNDVIAEFKRFFIRAIGIMLPLITFFIYLRSNGAFDSFLNYSIYGVKTFTNSLSYFDFIMSTNYLNRAIAIIIPATIAIAIFINVVFKFKKKADYTCLVLALYSLGMFSIVYPISDVTHFMIAIIPGIILLVYCFKLMLDTSKELRKLNYKYILEFTGVCSLLLMLSVTLLTEYAYRDRLGMISKYDYQKHFRYIDISAELNESITTINEFSAVKEKKVYILDATAAVYMIPIDRYNKDYDMFCIGNLGAGGENEIIDRIKNEDALYLIKKDGENINWQNPNKVRAYMKENMEYVGSKDMFDIYQNRAIVEENN